MGNHSDGAREQESCRHDCDLVGTSQKFVTAINFKDNGGTNEKELVNLTLRGSKRGITIRAACSESALSLGAAALAPRLSHLKLEDPLG